MTHTLGDQPIEPQYSDMMNVVAKTLDELFNGKLRGFERKVGFCLLVFQFGEESKRCNYISNADRDSVRDLLREQLARFDEQAKK